MMIKTKAVISKLIKKLIKSVQRFPETIVVVTFAVLFAILLNHDLGKEIEKLLMPLTLGLPLFSAFKLLLERKPLALKWRVIGDVLITGLLLGYYFIIPEEVDQLFMIRFFTMMGIFYLIFLLVPYFYKRKNFSVYCLKLVSNFFITYLYTLVLYLGIIAIIFTVDQLFGLNLDSTIYLDIFIVAVGIFGVTYFLGNMPQFEDELTIETYPVVIRVLIVTILMPLVTAYTVVLYAYFAKILFEWQWPEGLVGQLVVWYGLISIFILFMIQDLGENSPWLKSFKKYFPIAFLVPLTMMFIAIGIRIYHNGFTLPRYYVVLVGVWLLIMAGYYLIYQRSKTTFAIVSAIILLTISIFGPLNGTSVSILSQNNRLEAMLKESKMLMDGEVVPNPELSAMDQGKINSIVYYLDSLQAFDKVPYLPEAFTLSQMKDVFGFQYDYAYNPANEPNYFSYYQNGQNSITDLAPYDYVIRFAAYENSKSTITKGDLKFVASLENNKIEIYWGDQIIAVQSIEDIARTLYTRLGINNQAQDADMTYSFENDKAFVLLDFTNVYGTINDDAYQVTSIEGSAWVTLK